MFGYFTSEAEAREGEKKEPPAELAANMTDFQELIANVEYLDLPRSLAVLTTVYLMPTTMESGPTSGLT